MAEYSNSKPIRVLVTGFSPFQQVTLNPSWEIAKQLPKTLTSHNGDNIELLIPGQHVPSVYQELLTQSPTLIEKYDPDIVLHIGLAAGYEWFAAEQSANREGYHEIPDNERRVITRAENKKLFGKSPASLASSLDLESAVETWRNSLRGFTFPAKKSDNRVAPKGKEQIKRNGSGKSAKANKGIDVRLSNSVGNYVCGFVYYVSLLEMQKRKGRRDVAFLHTPLLEGDEEIGIGVQVAKELVKALVEAYEK
ncbi:hypothetical protein BDV96DRAFT_617140 [Lophiotrema nucula]|uniref:Peptidase C15, pyroglutamyl peptidase I-like protein n=1 Tax=Lophiotrema nucula TaxID=690887 RepID=A0A6A5YI92_9PLEO|nr:hypothetical protein BDV96DRAFT_617140 [Lophiotrema nucula]